MKFAFDEVKILRSTTPDRRLFIGGSDARIIMSADEAALNLRLGRHLSL